MESKVFQLPNSQGLPQIGLGLWKVKHKAQFNASFETAVAAGYRHFDTAQAYGNEAYLGEALGHVGLIRSDVWITTKVAVQNFGYNRTKQSIEASLKNLQTDYIDLALLHFPVPVLRKSSWRALEDLQAASKVRAIGVSNYTIRHLESMKRYARVMPAVNQVEMHVFLQQGDLLAYCRQHGIILEAYSPLAHGRRMDHPVLVDIARKHNVSVAQVMLRWCTERDVVLLPKSVTPERVKANIDLFHFVLDAEDMARLNKLDSNLHTCWNPTLVP
jgi:methylglyoxal/glyoxal reductase